MAKPRARDLGLDFQGVTGRTNSIVDVPGVLSGMTTRIEGNAIRTGVSAILPRGHETTPHQVWAGIHRLNGNGEMTGSHWIEDAGYFVGPICLTNTHSVGMVHHSVTSWMINHYGEFWSNNHIWAMPVVAETYDGVLNDINGQHISQQNTLDAINHASSNVVIEGNSGGGTGMICYDFKGGTGSASRIISNESNHYHIGAIVQANHGVRPWFTPLGVPVGRHMIEDSVIHDQEKGSVIAIIGMDIPLRPDQLKRIARRATIGIGRGGTAGGNSSGDIFLAFSTANSRPLNDQSTQFNFHCLDDDQLDDIYMAVIESVEEAVVNAMVAAEDMTTFRPHGQICRAINTDQLVEIMKKHGRCN